MEDFRRLIAIYGILAFAILFGSILSAPAQNDPNNQSRNSSISGREAPSTSDETEENDDLESFLGNSVGGTFGKPAGISTLLKSLVPDFLGNDTYSDDFASLDATTEEDHKLPFFKFLATAADSLRSVADKHPSLGLLGLFADPNALLRDIGRQFNMSSVAPFGDISRDRNSTTPEILRFLSSRIPGSLPRAAAQFLQFQPPYSYAAMASAIENILDDVDGMSDLANLLTLPIPN